MPVEPRILTYSEIERRSLQFLEEYHPSMKTPIPIEEIVEMGIGMDIFPMPNLYRNHGISGYLAKNRRTISVDQMQYEDYPEKYRFTLAHEVGHHVLHGDYYEEAAWTGTEDFVEWRSSVAPWAMDRFETQANQFAGLVLVPHEPLVAACNEVLEEYRSQLQEIDYLPSSTWEYLANPIARRFEVSPQVVQISIARGGIQDLVQLPR